MHEYPIVEVPRNAAELTEQLGTKPKFWFRTDDGSAALFKQVREGTGEDWAEKVAAELANLLGLPHAKYDLATWDEKRGVASYSFVPQGAALLHGNELLAVAIDDYPKSRRYSASQHTLDRAFNFLDLPFVEPPQEFDRTAGLKTGAHVFVGYLMLDAWIGNQDRHHENWGVIRTSEGDIHLAESYDHASSLGRNESDINRQDILTTRDKFRCLSAFVDRARSAFFSDPGSKKAMKTLDAFVKAAERYPDAAFEWRERLYAVTPDQIEQIFERIPVELAYSLASDFALAMLRENRDRILRTWGETE